MAAPVLSKEQFVWWKSLPETKVVQECVLEKVKEARLELAKKLGYLEKPELQASFLNGMEFAHLYDDLFDFGTEETKNAEDGRTQASY